MNSEAMALLGMLQASDSMFPIGQFTLSNGLETFVLEKRLTTDKELRSYLHSYLSLACYNDLLTFLLAYEEDIVKLDQLSCVLKAPEEIREGSRKLCSRFIKIWLDIGANPEIENYQRLIREGSCHGVYAVAAGLYAKGLGIDKKTGAMIFLYSQLSAIVVNAVKTVPLSQSKGQAALSDVLRCVPGIIEKACTKGMDALGVSGAMFDMEAMRHEHLYSRQYMS